MKDYENFLYNWVTRFIKYVHDLCLVRTFEI